MQSLGKVTSTKFSDRRGKPKRRAARAYVRKQTRKRVRVHSKSYSEPHQQEMSSRVWRFLLLIILALMLGYGLVSGSDIAKPYSEIFTRADALIRKTGFGIQKVSITGQHRVSDAAIAEALNLGAGVSILSFDTAQAQKRLENLSWIRRAKVMRLLPSTLKVEIEERRPFAIWQHDGIHDVVDKDGVRLTTEVKSLMGSLPLVVGKGAGIAAKDIVNSLQGYAQLRVRIKAAVRVADRRWTLKLKNGTDIWLPERNFDAALMDLANLEREHAVLSRDIVTIDMRLEDRITIRLKKSETAGHRNTSKRKSAEKVKTRSRPHKSDESGAGNGNEKLGKPRRLGAAPLSSATYARGLNYTAGGATSALRTI